MNARLADSDQREGLRHISEIMRTPPTYPIPVVERDAAHLVIYDVQQDGSKREMYDVPVSGVQDAKGVAFWFRQLALKTWVTQKHLHSLACAIHKLHEAG